jgi:DNA-binding XRE family transcriptional regulator
VTAAACAFNPLHDIVSSVATRKVKPTQSNKSGIVRIGHRQPLRLYLREWREYKELDAETMGGRLGVERESIYRIEREAMKRAIPEYQAAYAEALGIEPGRLWQPPPAKGQPIPPSLDEMAQTAPEAVRGMVFDVVRRMVSGG